MRSKKAKKLRKQIYGSEFSPRERKYIRNNKTGAIHCIERRQQYQQLKKKAKFLKL